MDVDHIKDLTRKIEAACPIYGVSVAADSDKSTWRIDYQDAATDAQKAAAQAIVDAYDPSAAITPASVTPYQARMALLNAGLLDQVEALIADPNTPKPVKLAWDWASIWERSSPFIAQLGASLGLNDAQIDALFVAAAGV